MSVKWIPLATMIFRWIMESIPLNDVNILITKFDCEIFHMLNDKRKPFAECKMISFKLTDINNPRRREKGFHQ